MKPSSSPILVLLSAHIYRAMHVAYPRDFRRAYGDEMAQVFGTACRETLRERGRTGLAELWLRTIIDLVATAWRERNTPGDVRGNIMRGAIAAAALTVASVARHLHSQTDADQTVLVIILVGAFLWGTMWPDRSRQQPLLIGLGAALLVLVGYGLSLSSLPGHDFDAPPPLTWLPLLVGGYAGATASGVVTRWKRPSPVPLR